MPPQITIKEYPGPKYQVEHLVCLKADKSKGSFIRNFHTRDIALYNWFMNTKGAEEQIIQDLGRNVIQLDIFKRKSNTDKTAEFPFDGVIKYIPTAELDEKIITSFLIGLDDEIDIEIIFNQTDKELPFKLILKGCRFKSFIHNGLTLDIGFYLEDFV